MQGRLDFWIIMFMAASAHGLFLFAMLLSKRGKKGAGHQGLLAALILCFTLTMAYYTTFWTGVNSQVPSELRVIFIFAYLFGPLAFLYLYRITYKSLPKYYLLHFIPFVLATTVSLFFITPQTYRWLNYPLPGFLYSLHLIVYGALCLSLMNKHKGNKWIRNVALSFNGFVLCYITYYLLSWTNLLQIEYDYMVSLGMTVFIYFIGYHGFRNPGFTYDKRPEKKYQKSSLTEDVLNQITIKLDTLMNSEKLYTDGDLKLTDVAKKLELTPHALSQAVNVSKAKKFTDYLNELRVQEAVVLMHQDEYQEAKLLAIAIDSGFNNKTSFLNAFKKHMNMSPSEYRKSLYSKAS